MTKTGIVLLNLGGPETLADVRPFLYRLFSDPDILVGVPAGARQALAGLIALIKGKSSIEIYRQIGGGSPQLRWTRAQAQGLAQALADPAGAPNATGFSSAEEYKVVIGMRASRPTIEAALTELADWGAEKLVLFSLFPQFSTTTTGSCFKECQRVLKQLEARRGFRPTVSRVHNWPDHPEYVKLLRQTLQEAIAAAEADLRKAGRTDIARDEIHVLFSAHSLPMKIVERGDPYAGEVERTLLAVADGLPYAWSLAYQSRNGKMPWLQPYTEDEIERLGKKGVKTLVVAQLSFVSDHIETLYELDMLYADHARAHGVERYHRARAFNDDPAFARALRSIYLESRHQPAGHLPPAQV